MPSFAPWWYVWYSLCIVKRLDETAMISRAVVIARHVFHELLCVAIEADYDAVQNLAPIYEQLADAFVHAKEKVVIAKVDADGAGKALGKRFEVKGYPSMRSHSLHAHMRVFIHVCSPKMV